MNSTDTYARPELLVDPDWLDSAKNDPNVCVVDCSGGHTQQWAYIPGAVALPVHFSLKDPEDPLHVIREEGFAEVMGRIGVTRQTTVVAYDRHAGMAAARLWWVLTYYGHRDVRLLNGGWHRWQAEGRPVALHAGTRPAAQFAAQVNSAVLAHIDYVREHVGRAGTQILDVRNRAEYAGPNPWGNRRTGHIPGALHWEWINTVSEQPQRNFRPADQLWRSLERLGLSPDNEVITHCQAGIRASHVAYVLNLLGFERVRNYEASMKEWANTDDAPLEEVHPSIG